MQVFIEIHEILALGVREDRPAEIDLCFTVQWSVVTSRFQTECGNNVVSGICSICQHVIQYVIAIDRACNAQVLRQAAEGEFGLLIVIGKLAARLT